MTGVPRWMQLRCRPQQPVTSLSERHLVNLGNIVDYGASSNFDKETLDADLVNPIFQIWWRTILYWLKMGVLWAPEQTARFTRSFQ